MYIISSLLVGAAARECGRSQWWWTLCSVLLTPVLTIVWLMLIEMMHAAQTSSL